jgi:hypothetical protein
MGRKPISTIKQTTDLRFSRCYGNGSVLPRKESDGSRAGFKDFGVPGVVGYTGYRPKLDEQGEILDRNKIMHAIPGYTGYLAKANPETLFGRSRARIAIALSQRAELCI